MAAPLFSSTNYIDSTTNGVVFGGGSWDPEYPQTNLAYPKFDPPTVSVDATEASTTITIDLGRSLPIRVPAAFPKHNLTRAATVRTRWDNTSSAMANTVYDETDDAWPDMDGTSQYGDYPDTADDKLHADVASGFNKMFYSPIPAAEFTARYGLINISDTANPFGQIVLNRLWVGPAFDFGEPVSGLTWAWVDPSTAKRSEGQVKYTHRRNRWRRAVMEFDGVDNDTARNVVLALQRQIGIAQQLLVIHDYESEPQRFQTSIVATLAEVSPLLYELYDYARPRWVLEEEL